MSDETKPKKSKKKEKVGKEEAKPDATAETLVEVASENPPAAENAPTQEQPGTNVGEAAKSEQPPAAKVQSVKKTRESKKPVKTGSNIFDNFTPEQVAEFKAGFQFMDYDKDGIISKEDIRACYDSIGRVSNDKELDMMIAEAKGPINFTQLLTLFFNRMSQSGDSDDDVTIQNAFRCYAERDGCVDAMKFREILMSGDGKFSELEADNALGEMDIENGRIDLEALIGKLTGTAQEQE